MNRRGLLGAILAAAAAPAFVKAGTLMPIYVPKLWTPADDTELLQGMIDRGERIVGGAYRISRTLILRDGADISACSIEGLDSFQGDYLVHAKAGRIRLEDIHMSKAPRGLFLVSHGASIDVRQGR
jgi:hypothetical protein